MSFFSPEITNSSHSPLFYSSYNSVLIKYPCQNSYECSPYRFVLPKGQYLIECYGASGGNPEGKRSTTARNGSGCSPQSAVEQFNGNTECNPGNSAGSGGFISGVISIPKATTFYGYIGGAGEYRDLSVPTKGGFNGGGNGNKHPNGCSSGGGATDLRAEVDDVFHRIIVAGGGGGSDDTGAAVETTNDGAGGSGGYPEGQGYWLEGFYVSSPIASQLYGFSFGQGESYRIPRAPHPNSTSHTSSTDVAGAGGGWFGGHISGNGNGGAGGGSSFILTSDCQIPSGEVKITDGFYNTLGIGYYAYSNNSPYVFKNIAHATGIWSGNGQMRITFLSNYSTLYSCNYFSFHQQTHLFNYFIISFSY